LVILPHTIGKFFLSPTRSYLRIGNKHVSMPVSTSTRSATAYMTPAFPLTPSQASLNPMSPRSTSSHTQTITSVGQVVKINAVTRIAIEGKAKQGEEGASVKMYLKVSYSETVNSKLPSITILIACYSRGLHHTRINRCTFSR